MRKLRATEVDFELTIEPEDTDPHGNELELEVLRRLAEGDEAAWCIVIVSAHAKDHRLHGYDGRAVLGGCTIGTGWMPGERVERLAWQTADQQDMKEEALASLNRQLHSAVRRGDEIRRILTTRRGRKRK